MDSFFKMIYSRLLLNEVKNIVKNYNIVNNEEKIIEVDKKMLRVIDSITTNISIFADKVLDFKNLPIGDSKETNRVMSTLVIYYIALYYDNMDLVKRLLENGITFGNNYNNLDLFMINPELSSKFETDLYIRLLKDQKDVIKNFYKSLYALNGEERNNDLNRFSYILSKNPYIAFKQGTGNRNSHFLTHQMFETFNGIEDDNLFNTLTKAQKHLIENAISNSGLSYEHRLKIKKLIMDYGYDRNLIYWNSYLNNFTIEEILLLTNEQINTCSRIFNMRNNYMTEHEKKSKIKKISKQLEKHVK